MDLVFTNKKLEELNGAVKTKALIKYLKDVSRNHSPIFVSGTKQDNAWHVNIYECTSPASKLLSIYLDAENVDSNQNGTELNVAFSENLIASFISGEEATFSFRENEIDIIKNGAKVKLPRIQDSENIKDTIEVYRDMFEQTENDNRNWFNIQSNSALIGLLLELKTSPNASLFVGNNNITYLNDTVLLRTAEVQPHFTSCNFTDTFLINSYLASKIVALLDYSRTVFVYKDDLKIYLNGQDENNNLIVRIVTPIYEAAIENPSDEDLAGITPQVETQIKTQTTNLLSTLDKQKEILSTFIRAKNNIEAKFYKENEAQYSLLFENNDDAFIHLHIKDDPNSEDRDIPEADYTKYPVALPINLIKCIGQEELLITYDNSDDSATSFVTGPYTILSGKIQ